MAKDSSFDIVSEFDKMELINSIEQTKKEINSRFDFKNSNSQIDLDQDKSITITTSDEMKLKNILDILQSKMIKRNLSIKILDPQKIEKALNQNSRQVINLKKGIPADIAKKIATDIKDNKFKVQVSIQGDSLRVTSKNKDDLQLVIQFICKNSDKYDLPLQFENYR